MKTLTIQEDEDNEIHKMNISKSSHTHQSAKFLYYFSLWVCTFETVFTVENWIVLYKTMKITSGVRKVWWPFGDVFKGQLLSFVSGFFEYVFHSVCFILLDFCCLIWLYPKENTFVFSKLLWPRELVTVCDLKNLLGIKFLNYFTALKRQSHIHPP